MEDTRIPLKEISHILGMSEGQLNQQIEGQLDSRVKGGNWRQGGAEVGQLEGYYMHL